MKLRTFLGAGGTFGIIAPLSTPFACGCIPASDSLGYQLGERDSFKISKAPISSLEQIQQSFRSIQYSKLVKIIGATYAELKPANLSSKQNVTVRALVDTDATFMYAPEQIAMQLGLDSSEPSRHVVIHADGRQLGDSLKCRA